MMFLKSIFRIKYECLIGLLGGILFLMTGCGVRDEAIVLIPSGEEMQELATLESVEQAAETKNDDGDVAFSEEKMLYVYVCGAVQNPGVVEVPKGSRAQEALQLAGGMTSAADPFYVNLAETVTDGQKLYFPTEEEAKSLENAAKAAEAGLVNINTADVTELCTLPGIGASRAADIVRYREQNGLFSAKEDIMKVAGIKQNAYDKLCDKITVK